MVPDVPFQHEVYPMWYLHHHWQIQSNQVHPEYNCPSRKLSHEHLRFRFGIGKPNHSSIRATVQHRFLLTRGSIHRNRDRMSGSNPGRNGVGKCSANGFRLMDGFQPDLLCFSSCSECQGQYLQRYNHQGNGILPA